MATGAIPLGSLLADRLENTTWLCAFSAKGHGTGSLIEGGAKSNKVLVVEDLINQGSSIKKGVEV